MGAAVRVLLEHAGGLRPGENIIDTNRGDENEETRAALSGHLGPQIILKSMPQLTMLCE